MHVVSYDESGQIPYTNPRMTHSVDKNGRELGAMLALDTNIIMDVCDDGEFAQHVRQCVGTGQHEIVISSSVIKELERHGRGMQVMPAILESRLGIQSITFDKVSEDERRIAKLLEAKHDLLHRGDSEILAFAYERGFVLVTCDNGLTTVARTIGVKCINPCTKGKRARRRKSGR